VRGAPVTAGSGSIQTMARAQSQASTRQERVYRGLRLIGPGPAAYYQDACRLMTMRPRLATTTHLVAHLLREVESGMRAVIGLVTIAPDVTGPSTPAKKKPGGASQEEGHARSILAILVGLEIDPSDPIATAWLRLSGRSNPDSLHGRAHRSGLNAPRLADEAFDQWWDDVQDVLEQVLDRFETVYARVFARLEPLLALESPTKAALDELSQKLPNTGVVRQHFFERLARPEWLGGLVAAGFFRSPPPPERDDERGTISFPYWPEAGYLTAVAAAEPAAVRDVIANVQTDNPNVQRVLIRAAILMPAQVAASLAPLVLSWTPTLMAYHGAEDAIGFARHLAEGGIIEEAFREMRLLLSLEATTATVKASLDAGDQVGETPGPASAAGSAPEDESSEGGAASGPIRLAGVPWHYHELLESLAPVLLASDAARTLATLCESLYDAIKVGRRRESAERRGDDDLGVFWMPELGDPTSDQDQDQDSERRELDDDRAVLAVGIRDLAIAAHDAGYLGLREILKIVRAQPWLSFRRLELHLLSKWPAEVPDLVAATLLDRATFDDSVLRTEYQILAGAGFPLLSPEQRAQWLGWVAELPDPERLSGLDEDDAKALIEVWQRDRVAPVSAELPPDWKRQFDRWVAEHGPPEPAIPPGPRIATWGGPRSPAREESLGAMSVEDLAQYLRSWEPSGERRSPTAEGLSRVLGRIIASDPERFAAQASLFAGTHAVYVRAVHSGLREALMEDRRFSWEEVLALSSTTAQRQIEAADPRSSSGGADVNDARAEGDGDEEQRDARRAVASLLEAGLAEGPNQIPLALREQVWTILERLAEDVDPSPTDESRMEESFDPSEMAINTVRGEAIAAVILYAAWVLGGSADARMRRFEIVPEAARVLERHLDTDPSLAVRAAIGRKLALLLHLDQEWTTAHLERVLPVAPEASEQWQAAWHGYVRFEQPWPFVLPALVGAYWEAITRIGARLPSGRSSDRPDDRLAEHLMGLYWQGAIDLNVPGNLVERFFTSAGPRLRAHAVRFVGRALIQTAAEKLKPETVARLVVLWEWRWATLRDRGQATGDAADEMVAFGAWVASRAFDSRWAFQYLRDALAVVGRTEPVRQVVAYLAELAPQMPTLVAQCLQNIDLREGQPWRISLWEQPARLALQAVLASDDPAARRIAEAVVGRWAARGHTEFLKLLTAERTIRRGGE
jgi:hypothetical protein